MKHSGPRYAKYTLWRQIGHSPVCKPGLQGDSCPTCPHCHQTWSSPLVPRLGPESLTQIPRTGSSCHSGTGLPLTQHPKSWPWAISAHKGASWLSLDLGMLVGCQIWTERWFLASNFPQTSVACFSLSSLTMTQGHQYHKPQESLVSWDFVLLFQPGYHHWFETVGTFVSIKQRKGLSRMPESWKRHQNFLRGPDFWQQQNSIGTTVCLYTDINTQIALATARLLFRD